MLDKQSLEKAKELLLKDIGETISYLKDLVEGEAENRKSLLLIESKLLDLNKQKLRGIISHDQYNVEVNLIRSNLIDFIDSLGKEQGQDSTKGNQYRRGSLLYQIPSQMAIGTKHKCKVRIAFNEDTILKNLELKEDTVLKDLPRISNVMEVEIIDPDNSKAFSIYAISEKEQFIDKDDYTEWLFYVTALKTGRFPLVLKISIVEIINDRERKRNIVLEEEVEILSETGKKEVGAAFKSSNLAFSLSLAPEVLDAPPAAAQDYTQPSTKSSKRFQTLMLSTLILLISAGAWAYPRIVHYNYWQSTLEANTVERYKEYLKEYPEGKYSKNAASSIIALSTPNTPKDSVIIKRRDNTKEFITKPQSNEPDTPKKKEVVKSEEKASVPKEYSQTSAPKDTIVKAPQKRESGLFLEKNLYIDVRDFKTYKVLEFDGVIWMTQNLNYKLRGSTCFGGNEENCKKFGRLYNWKTAQRVCPPGWRLPSDNDWKKLASAFGGTFDAVTDGGKKAYKNLLLGGISGFDAVLGGMRSERGQFGMLNNYGAYWTSSMHENFYGWYFDFNKQEQKLNRNFNFKDFAFSCRCITNK